MSITKEFFMDELISKSELLSRVLNFLKENENNAFATKEVIEKLNLNPTYYPDVVISRCLGNLVEGNRILKKHGFYLFNSNLKHNESPHSFSNEQIDNFDYSMFNTDKMKTNVNTAIKNLVKINANISFYNTRAQMPDKNLSKQKYQSFVIKNRLNM